MADLKQIRYQRNDGSYADDLRTYADPAANLVTALPAGSKRRLLDALGRVISEIDEATGDVARTRHNDAADGPRHALVHETAAPAVDDVIGRFAFRSRNDAGALYTGVELRALVKNAAAGSEEVWFEAGLMNGGAFVPAGLSLRVVAGSVKLFIDGVEAGTGGGGGPAAFSGARVTNSTDLTAISGDSPIGAPLTFDTERFDTDSYHDPATNPSRLTVPADGYYLIGAHVQWSSTVTGLRLLTLQIDGTTIIAKQGFGAAGTASRMISIQSMQFLSANSYVEVFARSTASSIDITVQPEWSPDFWITKLGE